MYFSLLLLIFFFKKKNVFFSIFAGAQKLMEICTRISSGENSKAALLRDLL